VSVDEARLVGRRAEQLALDALLGAGGRGALFIEGEAGIGKSTVWALGTAAAARAGWRVLTTRGSETETGLSFAGLTDLFDLVIDDVGQDLRPDQRDALELALLRKSASGAPLGQREVSVASLALLRRLCADGPVLLALDDVQWVDNATIDAVAFALRRLETEPIRVLATRRITGPGALTPEHNRADLLQTALGERLEILRLQPLDGPSIGQLLESRLGISLGGRGLAQLVERTRGNPFWALEIGTAIARHGMPDDRLPVPASLSTLVTTRLAELTPEVRETLLVCSALSAPTVALTTAALTDIADNPIQTIDAATAAGVVQHSGGRVRPAHPLLGSIALDMLPPGAKRRLYRRLAGVVADPEQHARLLALATDGAPDAEVARALDAGAVAARSRGAVSAAAQLAEQAAAMTPAAQAEDRVRRLIFACELLSVLGDVPTARRCAEEALAQSPATPIRCRAGLLLASIECWIDGGRGWQAHAEQALRDAGDNVELQAQAHALLANRSPAGASLHAERALSLLDQLGPEADPRTITEACLTLQMAHLEMGAGIDDELLRRAAYAEARLPRPALLNRAETHRAFWLKHVDDLDGSRSALQAAIEVASVEGVEAVLSNLMLQVALTELWAGRYTEAILAAEEAIRIGEEIDIPAGTGYYVRGQLAAYTGDFEWVRKELPARLALVEDAKSDRGIGLCLAAIGAGELLAGEATAAAATLGRAYETLMALGIREPSRRLRLESDYGQALITAGKLDEAASLVAELRSFGPRSAAPTTRGIALRIDGLISAARGDLDRAMELLDEAARVHEESPLALERGRTLLAFGQVLRRRRAKARAGANVRAALDIFVDLGATPFIESAQEELTSIGGGSSNARLTAAEQRVADLVANGLTNQQIATRLFVSVRTIESHLASTYRKIGVRSRIELARTMNRSQTETPSPTAD